MNGAYPGEMWPLLGGSLGRRFLFGSFLQRGVRAMEEACSLVDRWVGLEEESRLAEDVGCLQWQSFQSRMRLCHTLHFS